MVDDGRKRKLPGAELAIIDSAKLTDYLLNADHPVGGDKAAYLTRFGFRRESWQVLESALLVHAREADIIAERGTMYGHQYTLEGSLSTPDGRNPVVRTAWLVRSDEQRPRFVTAHPGRRHMEGMGP